MSSKVCFVVACIIFALTAILSVWLKSFGVDESLLGLAIGLAVTSLGLAIP